MFTETCKVHGLYSRCSIAPAIANIGQDACNLFVGHVPVEGGHGGRSTDGIGATGSTSGEDHMDQRCCVIGINERRIGKLCEQFWYPLARRRMTGSDCALAEGTAVDPSPLSLR